MSERLTASVQGPTSGQRSLHCRQNASRARQRVEGIDRWRRILKRGSIGEDKGNGLASLDRELADRSEIFAVESNRGSHKQALRAGNRADRAVIEPVDPWHGRPVVEAHHQLSLKIHAPRSADHDPHKIGTVARRHEIDHRCGSGLGLEFGFEDQRAGTIAPCGTERWILRGNKPTPIVGFPEQGGKARSRIETGPAQPIDRTVAADQSGRLTVAYQCIALRFEAPLLFARIVRDRLKLIHLAQRSFPTRNLGYQHESNPDVVGRCDPEQSSPGWRILCPNGPSSPPSEARSLR